MCGFSLVEPRHEQVGSDKDSSPAPLTLTECFPTSSSLPAAGLPLPCPVLACPTCRRGPDRWDPEAAAGLESETLTIRTRPPSADIPPELLARLTS